MKRLLIASVVTLVLAAPAAAQEERFQIASGARVSIRSPEGDIRVRAVSGREGRARLDSGEDEDLVTVRRSGNSITIEPMYGDGGDMLVSLPGDVSLEVVGLDGDISIVGFSNEITIETFDGDVDVDGAGVLSIRTVDGDVQVRNVARSAAVDFGDGDVHLTGVRGPVAVNGVDGDITVQDADSRQVAIATISGNLWYDGRVYDGGEYQLGTHDGDVTFAVPQGVGATVSVLSYDGALIPSFPLQMRGSVGSIAEFTLGDGSAHVQLESFDGNIHLIRPGERSPDRQ